MNKKNLANRIARRKLSKEYYDGGKENLTIKEVVSRWAEHNAQMYDSRIHTWLPIREIWPIREYTWTRDKARSGHALVDGEYVYLPGPEKWDAIKADMNENGWREKEQPVNILVGREGNAKVGEGNHRLAIAREIGLRDVPVRFQFQQKVRNGHQIIDMDKVKLDKQVDDIMNILS